MGKSATVAAAFTPLLELAFGSRPPLRLEFWDGSAVQPGGDHPGTMVIRSKDALSHMVWAPGELGLGRAFVAGAVDLDGDISQILRALQSAVPGDARLGVAGAWRAVGAARRLGAKAAAGWQAASDGGCILSDFAIDWNIEQFTCPQGTVSDSRKADLQRPAGPRTSRHPRMKKAHYPSIRLMSRIASSNVDRLAECGQQAVRQVGIRSSCPGPYR